jgi:perosamine synthetase
MSNCPQTAAEAVRSSENHGVWRHDEIIAFIRSLYPGKAEISLHEPVFGGREKEYLARVIDSTYVSYLGEFVVRFEEMIGELTGAKFAVATANGTTGLHLALRLAGVQPGEEVLTQALTFVATANAITYCGARPLFLDVDPDTLGLSPEALEAFLTTQARQTPDGCYNRLTGRRLAACLPMHTFGHPCRIDRVAEICARYRLPLVEDAAEALGSTYRGRHTGTFGLLGIFSFNGNKTVTCGGGGVIITDDEDLARAARHLSGGAKMSHPYEFIHDDVGYNYRLPNLNAALACAQLEQLPNFLRAQRELAAIYQAFFQRMGLPCIAEPQGACSNYWLNAVLLPSREERDEFLQATNRAGIKTRPVWRLMSRLPMYQDCYTDGLEQSRWLEDRLVNLPSSVRPCPGN